MKKLNVIILSAAVIFVSFSTLVSADDDAIELELTYTFKYPIIEKSKIIIPEAEMVGNPGEPAMPSVAANILIPFEKKVDKISLTVKEKIKLGDDFDIQPVDKVVPTSDLQLVDNVETKKDDRIYSSDEEFPGKLFSEVGTYSFRGYIILVLELFPVQYNPVTGEAFFYKSMEQR